MGQGQFSMAEGGLLPCFTAWQQPSASASSRGPLRAVRVTFREDPPSRRPRGRGLEVAACFLAGSHGISRSRAARSAMRAKDLELTKTTKRTPPAVQRDMELEFAERAQESLLKTGREHDKGILIWNQPGWEFTDVANIFVKSGKGGNGCKSFHREMNMPLMGPDGGDGGDGGHIYLQCASMSNTLKQLRERTHYHAGNGGVGMGSSRRGADGEDKIIRVPPGTVVWVRERWVPGCEDKKSHLLPFDKMLIREEDIRDRRLIGELTQHGQMLRVCRGGKGGKGNEAFKTRTNTAPFFFTKGQRGIGRWIDLELKIVSDIGIIGVPNAGKSSLLHAVTDHKPKIAAYPFTTTIPNLGHWKYDVHGGITLVDVPGLIEGAADGRGMGIRFLRHIERCPSLMHVIAGDSEDPIGDYETIQNELKHYSTEVSLKPQVIVVNKVDLPEVQERLPALMKELRRRSGHSRVFDVSAATRYNTEELMQRVYRWHKARVRKEWNESAKGAPGADANLIVGRRELMQLGEYVDEVAVGDPIDLDQELPKGRRKKSGFQARVEWDVIEEAWRLYHPEVEEIARRTDWSYEGVPGRDAGYDRLNRVLKATGMREAMKAAGLKEGEVIIVADHKFSYHPDMIGQEARMLWGAMELRTIEQGEKSEFDPQ
ncbi:GTPase Obg (GTP-binding protein Obg) [Durusdinium trenchii]|uniref:GTPase Obg (GTP-binding protein Obg) n=1 Tax=Durusdinium trenchii TaxID=1381693 RepID=A0ABP0IYY9_9DINO